MVFKVYCILLLALGTVLAAASVLAVEAPAPAPGVPENALQESAASGSFGPLQPLTDLLRPLFVRLSVIVGGIFGLYVILIAVRVYYERKKLHLLKDIRYDLDQLNISRGVPASKQNAGKLHRLLIDRLFPFHVKKHYAPQRGKAMK